MQNSVSEGPAREVGLLSELNHWDQLDPESGGAGSLCPIWLSLSPSRYYMYFSVICYAAGLQC
jgi:hypothetical protein